MPSSSLLRRIALPLLLLPVLPSTASGQTAADVMADFRAAYEQRMEGIENYTVVQRVMGTETTTYFERETVDGVPFFRPRVEVGGVDVPTEASLMDHAFFLRPDVAERMTYEGTDEVAGARCRIVRLTDFEGLTGAQEEKFELESMSFCLDGATHMVRRMEMEGRASRGGDVHPMRTVAIFQDYREIGGMLHPYRVEMTMSGMGMGGEEQARMQEAMAEMEKQLEQLPPAQRERMRGMMKSRMGAVEGATGMASGEPMIVETMDVKVNAGPPEGGGGK